MRSEEGRPARPCGGATVTSQHAVCCSCAGGLAALDERHLPDPVEELRPSARLAIRTTASLVTAAASAISAADAGVGLGRSKAISRCAARLARALACASARTAPAVP